MKIMLLVSVLVKLKLLTPSGLISLIRGFYRSGVNLMTLVEIAAKRHGPQEAIVDDYHTFTYKELFQYSNRMATKFYDDFHLQPGMKVAILCRNHTFLISSLCAVSRIGADLHPLNTEMSLEQLKYFVKRYQYDAIIFDDEFKAIIEASNFTNQKIKLDPKQAINQEKPRVNQQKMPKSSKGRIILQTGGTTGKAKEAVHTPSLFYYLNPFMALLKRLRLTSYHTIYIGTPIFHGYGLAILLLSFPLGKKCVLTNRFEAEKACSIVQKHHVEVITVVPLMLKRMLQYNHPQLTSLRCIASGGALLDSVLIEETTTKLGDILYNLYGTSETGLNVIATPRDLRYSSQTIGRKVFGAVLDLKDKQMNTVPIGVVGQLYVKNSWSVGKKKNKWLRTGDLGYQDKNGYYYLCGRVDEMIISGGVNVFPSEVEQILITHPEIEDVVVIGIQDKEYGQRLQAFIQTDNLTESDITKWLKPRIARFQMPKKIHIIDDIPYTAVGKPDKKKIVEMITCVKGESMVGEIR
ncbi:AMP-binding protein [Ornithinibacillus xuwenensis]|uniref:AMP-binding protein n=1 Tax=Ornithinibacillus xuwenensis TaxID=3144668 RepID=A0ABU9XBI5_9BACI